MTQAHATDPILIAFAPIMEDHNFQRVASVLATLAIAALLFGTLLWLGYKTLDVTPLRPRPDQWMERGSAGEDLLPSIVPIAICDDERPCS